MYADEAEKAEAQRVWDQWSTWVTTPPADYADWLRMLELDSATAAALPPAGWSETEAAAAQEYMRLRAGG